VWYVFTKGKVFFVGIRDRKVDFVEGEGKDFVPCLSRQTLLQKSLCLKELFMLISSSFEFAKL